MQGYETPEHEYYEMTLPCLYKQRKRTGFKWLYSLTDRLQRHGPDVRPGQVSTSIIDQMGDNDQEDDQDEDQQE